ncbi:hypothetical protein SAMN02745664_103132 [Moraxella cuniculi DSM 21768]|uniref:Transposase n=1 Tax=Moraxella cuniculi DSM 21768 TaxID=1122245 RepID=A0A1N7E6Z3_9GAMM|nr:hypothetical protein SAMN02745664_103132 [Moraxella cuniculi DSM 21768]
MRYMDFCFIKGYSVIVNAKSADNHNRTISQAFCANIKHGLWYVSLLHTPTPPSY